MEEIIERWESYKGAPQELGLPSAPKQFLHYFREDDRPQTRLDRNLENGMAVSIGRLRPDTQYDYQICLPLPQHAARRSRRRGADGGAALAAKGVPGLIVGFGGNQTIDEDNRFSPAPATALVTPFRADGSVDYGSLCTPA